MFSAWDSIGSINQNILRKCWLILKHSWDGKWTHPFNLINIYNLKRLIIINALFTCWLWRSHLPPCFWPFHVGPHNGGALCQAEMKDFQLILLEQDLFRRLHMVFGLCLPSKGDNFFHHHLWSIFQSSIFTHYITNYNSFMLDLCGQLSCTASTPVFLTCGFSSWLLYFCWFVDKIVTPLFCFFSNYAESLDKGHLTQHWKPPRNKG